MCVLVMLMLLGQVEVGWVVEVMVGCHRRLDRGMWLWSANIFLGDSLCAWVMDG